MKSLVGVGGGVVPRGRVGLGNLPDYVDLTEKSGNPWTIYLGGVPES